MLINKDKTMLEETVASTQDVYLLRQLSLCLKLIVVSKSLLSCEFGIKIEGSFTQNILQAIQDNYLLVQMIWNHLHHLHRN